MVHIAEDVSGEEEEEKKEESIEEEELEGSEIVLESYERQECEVAQEAALKTDKLSQILVADDQEINLMVLKEFFRALDVSNVTYCVNGQVAIDTCKAGVEEAVLLAEDNSTVKPYSLVILDFQMPYKNGIQVIQEVRAHYDLMQTRCPTLKLVQPKFVINSAFKT